jgi:hypothetical protein
MKNSPKAPDGELFRKSNALRDLIYAIGDSGLEFLEKGVQGFSRLLPHTELGRWKVRKLGKKSGSAGTKVSWADSARRSLNLVLGVNVIPRFTKASKRPSKTRRESYLLNSSLRRMSAPSGVGQIERTIDDREKTLCHFLARRITASITAPQGPLRAESLRAIAQSLEERVVAAHLRQKHGLEFDLAKMLFDFRELAEQSYENKALTFGLIVSCASDSPASNAVFPADFLRFKRYRALADGFRTAYRISKAGKFLILSDLQEATNARRGSHFYPEWGSHLVDSLQQSDLAMCLTRQGDILVFDSGSLRFTYRHGSWQYWNHRHVVDLLRNRARVQHVSTTLLPRVVGAIYRVALDVSFRRSGGLFVLLRNQQNLRKLVIEGDAIGDDNREPVHKEFDAFLENETVYSVPRNVLAQIAGLDGAVVLNNKGRIMAYGAVLKTRGKFNPSEGSRTKAAISASRYGIAIKVSSDGDITFYEGGDAFLVI